jgi:hypothetical protein
VERSLGRQLPSARSRPLNDCCLAVARCFACHPESGRRGAEHDTSDGGPARTVPKTLGFYERHHRGPTDLRFARSRGGYLEACYPECREYSSEGLSVEPKMFIASLGEQDPVMVRSRVCEENRARGAGKDGTLFPTVELMKSVTLHTDANEIIKETNRTGSFSPAFVVCASYKSTFDDRSRYNTGIMYYLRRIDPAHPGIYFRMTNGCRSPATFSRLTMILWVKQLRINARNKG